MGKICSAVFRLWNQCLLSCSHLQHWNMISCNMGTCSAANSTKFSYKTSRCELCGSRYTRLSKHWELKYLDVSFVDAVYRYTGFLPALGTPNDFIREWSMPTRWWKDNWSPHKSKKQTNKKNPHLPGPPVHGVSCQKLRNWLKSVYPNICIMGAAFCLPFNGHQVRRWVETFPQSNIYCFWRATGWTLLKYY